jgi:hypothetical protein
MPVACTPTSEPGPTGMLQKRVASASAPLYLPPVGVGDGRTQGGRAACFKFTLASMSMAGWLVLESSSC